MCYKTCRQSILFPKHWHNAFFRLANNVFYFLNKKNSVHIEHQIRNVRKIPNSGKFWLFDNEFSVYAGFRCLYAANNGNLEYTLWYWLQEQILKTCCIFNEETIQKIRKLASVESAAEHLLPYTRMHDPLYGRFEAATSMDHLTQTLFRERFHERIKFLLNWIDYCEIL